MARLTKKQRVENEARAQRARNVVDAYALDMGEFTLADLLADFMHRAQIDCEAENFEDALRRARMHFEAESEGSN
jgi:hypothetical protein